MLWLALGLLMAVSVVVAGWAFANSEKEREELGVALDDLRQTFVRAFRK